jgi:hypothetical protein
MLPNAFIGKSKKPTTSELTEAIGASKVFWDELVAKATKELEIDNSEWNSYSPKAGWALRLKHKKRNMLYLSPFPGSFCVTFILGDKAIKAARAAGLPARAIKLIDEAKRYPEGTAIRIEVKKAKDLELIVQLATFKMEN